MAATGQGALPPRSAAHLVEGLRVRGDEGLGVGHRLKDLREAVDVGAAGGGQMRGVDRRGREPTYVVEDAANRLRSIRVGPGESKVAQLAIPAPARPRDLTGVLSNLTETSPNAPHATDAWTCPLTPVLWVPLSLSGGTMASEMSGSATAIW